MTTPASSARSSSLMPGSALRNTYEDAAQRCRIVFFAGLPAVGKSFHLKQFSLLATEAGRRVHLLQYDVARVAFETEARLEQYPISDGVTHAMIRRGVGVWVRHAIADWHRANADPSHIIVGELPLIGNRFIEVAKVEDDDAETLLASEQTHVFIPVPTERLRDIITSRRTTTLANPAHEREALDAPQEVLEGTRKEVNDLAVTLGLVPQQAGGTPTYSPSTYAAVYSHLLRHRHHDVLIIDDELGDGSSVYEHDVAESELMASEAEVERTYATLEQEGVAIVEATVARWFDYS